MGSHSEVDEKKWQVENKKYLKEAIQILTDLLDSDDAIEDVIVDIGHGVKKAGTETGWLTYRLSGEDWLTMQWRRRKKGLKKEEFNS